MTAIIVGLVLLLGAAAYLTVRFLRARRNVLALQQSSRRTHVLQRADQPDDRVDEPGQGEGADEAAPDAEADGQATEEVLAPRPRPRQRPENPFTQHGQPDKRHRRSWSGRLVGILITLAVAGGIVLIGNEVRKRYMVNPVAIDPCSVCKVDKVSIDQLTCEKVGEKKWQFFGHKCNGPEICGTCAVGNCFSDDIDTPPSDAACNVCVTAPKSKTTSD